MTTFARKGLSFLLFLLSTASLTAQFQATNANTYTMGTDDKAPSIDTIFIFDALNPFAENTIISYQQKAISSFSWYKIEIENNSVKEILIPSSITTNTNKTELNSIEEGCYALKIGNTVTKYIWVFDHSNYPIAVTSFLSSNAVVDPCKNIQLEASISQNPLSMFDITAKRWVNLQPDHVFNWLPDDKVSETKNLESFKSFEAPFSDTEYSVRVTNQFFDDETATFGLASETLSYDAIAVNFDEIEATINERDGDNEVDRSVAGELRGSAPLDVSFSPVNPSEKVLYYQWEIWKNEGENPAIIRYNTEDILHRFTDPIEETSGSNTADYITKLTVSNDLCDTTQQVEVFLSDSYLSAANIFVIGFGVNVQYKCEYKSIRPGTFKGVILNRWGRKMFTWTDPQIGWDGKTGGRYVSPGPYYILLEAEGTDGSQLLFRSDLTILREK